MSAIWKTYWPIFEQLEAELCDLSFSVTFCDDHLSVYSSRLSDVLMRSCAECENIGKSLCLKKNLVASATEAERLNFPAIGRNLCGKVAIDKLTVTVIWPYQTLSNTLVQPFKDWSKSGKTNPSWFKAYNDVKHNRLSGGVTGGSLNNVIFALGGLFILNLWLREEDIIREMDDVDVLKRRVTSYSRFFSPEAFLQPTRANGISTSGVVSFRLRNLEFRWK